MVSKILNKLNSINTFSKNIIVYASIISLALCFSGVGVIIYNLSAEFSKVSLHTIGSTLIYSAIILFAQSISGSLVIDFLNTVITNHED